MNSPSLARLARLRPLILGSRSPRRVRLLNELGIPFRQVVPAVDETVHPGEDPYDSALRLAKDKALAVARSLADAEVAIGCDTVVVLDRCILGKPTDAADAVRILEQLVGKKHVVCTAVALADRGGLLASGYDLTEVYFNPATRLQLERYIASGEPMDKAGAYGIQGMGGFLVDRIEGALDNVVGLPRELLESLAYQALTKLEAS